MPEATINYTKADYEALRERCREVEPYIRTKRLVDRGPATKTYRVEMAVKLDDKAHEQALVTTCLGSVKHWGGYVRWYRKQGADTYIADVHVNID